MSEPSPSTQYIIAEQPAPRVHHCPSCGEEIGVEVERAGRVYLQTGNRLSPFLPDGYCAVCGQSLRPWEPGWRRLKAALDKLHADAAAAPDEVRRAAEEAGRKGQA